MENRSQITEELREVAPMLAGLTPANPYRVPGGYFSALPASVLDHIQTAERLGDRSALTYQAPAGYFEGLPAAILSRIRQEVGEESNEVRAELVAVAPLLDTISRENVYAVPQGYFEAAHFSAKARQGKAKVVKMNLARRWVQYAAAAVISGVLVTSAFLYTDNSTSAEYNKYSRIDVPAELNKVSEDDLTSYLDNNEHYAIAAELNAPVNEDITDGNEPVQVLSDEELDQYLKENAEATAAAKKI